MMQNSPWLEWLAICLCRFVARQDCWKILEPLPNEPVSEDLLARPLKERTYPTLAGWKYALSIHRVYFTGPEGETLVLSLQAGRTGNPKLVDSSEF